MFTQTFFPIFAKPKQTYLPGDTTKTNSRVKDGLVLHLTLPKLGCVLTGFLHLAVPGSARVNVSVVRSSCVAQLLVVKDFRETSHRLELSINYLKYLVVLLSAVLAKGR